MGLATLILERDVALVEVNPLVITATDELHCLDAKLVIDSNAVYRQPQIRDMHDPSQDDEREAHAAQWELNYVALDGNIGCMVNGAGLAMGTMDIVNLHGGSLQTSWMLVVARRKSVLLKHLRSFSPTTMFKPF